MFASYTISSCTLSTSYRFQSFLLYNYIAWRSITSIHPASFQDEYTLLLSFNCFTLWNSSVPYISPNHTNSLQYWGGSVIIWRKRMTTSSILSIKSDVDMGIRTRDWCLFVKKKNPVCYLIRKVKTKIETKTFIYYTVITLIILKWYMIYWRD